MVITGKNKKYKEKKHEIDKKFVCLSNKLIN